jgi:predicted Zn-dependent protease
MRFWVAGVILAGLAGCVALPPGPLNPGPLTQGPIVPAPASNATGMRAFQQVVAQVEPVAETLCRQRTRGVPCDYQIALDTRPGQPPNAFQTLDGAGRPIIGFTPALIADARNADELAFVLGHEAAHHIAGHIPRQQETAMTGALLAGVLASLGGADEATIRQVQQVGATVGARQFSKDFELEADALGAEIALIAGYDPLRGAAFFDRLPDPGDEFLGTHPPNAARRAIVQATVARLTGR